MKNTVRENWMIPYEAVGKHCLLVAEDEKLAICQLGIIVAKEEYLRGGKNQDGKRSITAENFKHIYWILLNEPYPPNFWERIGKDISKEIMSASSGTQRLVRFFQLVQKQPISRDLVVAVGQQKDSLKRVRRNGGARDALAAQGIILLSGAYDLPLVKSLGLPEIKKNEFISMKVESHEHRELLKKSKHLR